MADTDTCICCGAEIPEGRQVCWTCEHKEATAQPGPWDPDDWAFGRTGPITRASFGVQEREEAADS